MFDDNNSMRRETGAKAEVNTQRDIHKQKGRWEMGERCVILTKERGGVRKRKGIEREKGEGRGRDRALLMGRG